MFGRTLKVNMAKPLRLKENSTRPVWADDEWLSKYAGQDSLQKQAEAEARAAGMDPKKAKEAGEAAANADAKGDVILKDAVNRLNATKRHYFRQSRRPFLGCSAQEPASVPGHQDRQDKHGPHHCPPARRRRSQDGGELQMPLHQREGVWFSGEFFLALGKIVTMMDIMNPMRLL